MNGRFLVTNCLKKARKLFKKEKSCTKSEKLLEGLKVAPNLKSCSNVAEQLIDSLTELLFCSLAASFCYVLIAVAVMVCLKNQNPMVIYSRNKNLSILLAH